VSVASHAALRLHGYPVSNYFNIARAALIEKGVAFEVVIIRASQSPEFLAANPMGKIPILETPQGWVAETVAILEYLEDTLAVPALHPAEPYQRARGRQIINVVQMYVEAQIRVLFPGVFLGSRNADATIDAARLVLDRAVQALSRLMTPNPYLLGASLSHADLFAFYCLDIADRVTRSVYGRSLTSQIGGLADWSRCMANRRSTHVVFADFYPAFAKYLAGHAAAYDCYRDIEGVFVPPAAVRA
jgi:glutathione S-transferase